MFIQCKNPKYIFWIFGIGVPSLALLVSDTIIYLKVVKSIFIVSHHTCDVQIKRVEEGSEKDKNRFLMMLGIIFVVFTLSYLPFVIINGV